MAKTINILVACGSGVATSTLASKTVEEICKEVGINANIQTSSMRDIVGNAANADIVLTTNKYDKDIGKPILSIISFVTGLGVEKTKQNLIDLLNQYAQEK